MALGAGAPATILKTPTSTAEANVTVEHRNLLKSPEAGLFFSA
jgi:hypothetical protein